MRSVTRVLRNNARRVRSTQTRALINNTSVRSSLFLAMTCGVSYSSTITPFRTFCATSSSEHIAQKGFHVEVDYVGTLDDGTVFDSSEGKTPLAFKVGAGQMIPGFDRAVQGMSVGETKEIHLSPADAYGEHEPRGVIEVPIEKLPEGCEVGTRLKTGQGGQAVVTKIEGETATVDLNHPMAGKALNFSITLVGVKAAPQLKKTTITPGDGVHFPKKGDKLTMHYTGTLAANGQKFDSSVDRGQPFQFQIGVGQVIAGWDQGVMQMSLGEKATLEIPSDLGYGARGAGGAIPPDADLVFEVELLKIN